MHAGVHDKLTYALPWITEAGSRPNRLRGQFQNASQNILCSSGWQKEKEGNHEKEKVFQLLVFLIIITRN
jgi:hypothetical protein